MGIARQVYPLQWEIGNVRVCPVVESRCVTSPTAAPRASALALKNPGAIPARITLAADTDSSVRTELGAAREVCMAARIEDAIAAHAIGACGRRRQLGGAQKGAVHCDKKRLGRTARHTARRASLAWTKLELHPTESLHLRPA